EVADLLRQHLADLQHPSLPPKDAPPPGSRSDPGMKAPSGSTRRLHWAAAAGVVLMLAMGLGMAEATGVSNMRGTVIRWLSPEGMLVVEVDDPAVRVAIDGADLVIIGTGVQEVRLKSGRHTLQAIKDGKVVQQELITVTNQGRQVVRVRREEKLAPAAAARNESGVAVIGEGPVREVAARLRELNPEFQGEISS